MSSTFREKVEFFVCFNQNILFMSLYCSDGGTIKTVLLVYNDMYRGLTDAEFRGGGADRGPVLYDVKSQTFRPLFHITLQSATLPAFCCSILCGGKRAYAERVWHNAGFSTGTEP